MPPVQESFFQRIGKYIILFTTLGFIAFLLTVLVVSIGINFGGALPMGFNLWFDFSVFFSFLIGFVITPIVIVYVTRAMAKVKKNDGGKNPRSAACPRGSGLH